MTLWALISRVRSAKFSAPLVAKLYTEFEKNVLNVLECYRPPIYRHAKFSGRTSPYIGPYDGGGAKKFDACVLFVCSSRF